MEKSISILPKLAKATGRKDEKPNVDLAIEIVRCANKNAIKELVAHLANKKEIQNDCIKVLYEIGDRKPELIAPYLPQFLSSLNHKNNRLVWGAMIALSFIAKVKPKAVYTHLSEIIIAAEKSSVITKDNTIKLLINLADQAKYRKDVFILLMEQLLKSPVNQLPMYAELILPIVSQSNKKRFISVLNLRLNDVEKASKRKRIEKVIKKLI